MQLKNTTALLLIALLAASPLASGAENKPKEKRDLSAYPIQKQNGKKVRLIPAEDYLLWKEVPIPPAPTRSGVSIAVSIADQRAWLFENGILLTTSAICPGKQRHQTPKGRFTVIAKHEKWISTIYKVPMPYFLRLNAANGKIGLHAGAIALQPASHGCIRLPKEMAKTFFEASPEGTPVVVF